MADFDWGNIDWTSLGQSAGGLLGGYLQGQTAQNASQQTAAQLQQAGQQAKFTPFGVSTSFGQSGFQYDPSGTLTGANYQLSPGMQEQLNTLFGASGGMLNQFTGAQGATAPMGAAAQQAMGIGSQQMTAGQGAMNAAGQWSPNFNAVNAATSGMGSAAQQAMGLGNQQMQAAQGALGRAEQWNPNANDIRASTAGMGMAAQRAMGLGNQYLNTDPRTQAASYLGDQQNLLAPGRARELSELQAKMSAQGRTGFAMGGGVGGQQAANPEMQAYWNARMQQDAQLAANATQGGMDYTKFGLGTVGAGGDMLSSMYGAQSAAYNPYRTAMGIGQDQAKFGMGTAAAGGDMLRNMYGTQAASYDPYRTAMGVGQEQTKFGLGTAGTGGGLLKDMYGTQTAAYDPYGAAMGGATAIDALGQKPLDLSTAMGSQKATSAANMLSGMQAAAPYQTAAQSYNPWAGLLMGQSSWGK